MYRATTSKRPESEGKKKKREKEREREKDRDKSQKEKCPRRSTLYGIEVYVVVLHAWRMLM